MSHPPPEQTRLASASERTRELELELRRVRAAATAARLEARAAKIELWLRRAARRTPAAGPDFSEPDRLPIDSWQQLVQGAALWHEPAAEHALPLAERTDERARVEGLASVAETAALGQLAAASKPAGEPAGEVVGDRGGSADLLEFSSLSSAPAAKSLDDQPGAIAKAAEAGQETGGATRRKRPAAWIISTLAHVALLLLLAATTISIAKPKDQIALQAATPPANESRIETIPLEQVDQPEETAPRTPLRVAVEPSPIGTIMASEIEVEVPELTAPPSDSLNPMLKAASSLADEGLPELNSQFFGVQGGGNHFVYLVDNSGSMGSIARDGFDVARHELLESIAALNQDQRFYVIFFGEEMLRMRISDPSEPEPRSVYATAENKAALRRWAMGIEMQPGRWPEKPLQFAFQLRPDVIFLLTDGEMSQKVEPMIRKHNLVESLFAAARPRSIIHTIGFYSRDGAEQMQQIAQVNGGTYRFVPPPPKR